MLSVGSAGAELGDFLPPLACPPPKLPDVQKSPPQHCTARHGVQGHANRQHKGPQAGGVTDQDTEGLRGWGHPPLAAEGLKRLHMALTVFQEVAAGCYVAIKYIFRPKVADMNPEETQEHWEDGQWRVLTNSASSLVPLQLIQEQQRIKNKEGLDCLWMDSALSCNTNSKKPVPQAFIRKFAGTITQQNVLETHRIFTQFSQLIF